MVKKKGDGAQMGTALSAETIWWWEGFSLLFLDKVTSEAELGVDEEAVVGALLESDDVGAESVEAAALEEGDDVVERKEVCARAIGAHVEVGCELARGVLPVKVELVGVAARVVAEEHDGTRCEHVSHVLQDLLMCLWCQ